MLLITSEQRAHRPNMNRRDFLVSSPSAGSAFQAVVAGIPEKAVDHATRLAAHDIVYLTPSDQRSESFPIGNGDLVGMVTMPARGLDLVINKANLWDDRPDIPPLSPPGGMRW